MWIVLTLFRGMFWVPFARGTSRQAHAYQAIAESSRGEKTRLISQAEWDKEQVVRKRERSAEAFAAKWKRDVEIEAETERNHRLQDAADARRLLTA